MGRFSYFRGVEKWLRQTRKAEVTVHIYNLKGQLIRALKLGNQPAGSYLTKGQAAHWNGQTRTGEPAASGLYFYTIQAHSTANGTGVEDFIATRRMILVK